MVTIKAFRERQYHLSKYGDKLFIDSDDGNVAFKLAVLTGKMLKTEEELVYTSAGKTKKEAEKSLEDYLKATKLPFTISRKEVTKT